MFPKSIKQDLLADLPEQLKVGSSAYKKDLALETKLERTLINIRNIMDTRINPCGTPEIIGNVSELHWPYLTFCVRLER